MDDSFLASKDLVTLQVFVKQTKLLFWEQMQNMVLYKNLNLSIDK